MSQISINAHVPGQLPHQSPHFGDDFLAIEDRAKEIDAMLDAGRYDELIP